MLAARLRKIPKPYLTVGLVLLLVLGYALIFRERTIPYAYSGTSCDRQLTLLPGLFKQTGPDDYKLTLEGGWKIGNFPVLATSVCAAAQVPPQEGKSAPAHISPFGGPVARLSYAVEAGPAPQPRLEALSEPIPVSRPMILPLSTPDSTFSYKLVSAGRQAVCRAQQFWLECDVPALGLEQGAAYDISLERYFRDQPAGVVAKKSIETLSPVTITASSIQNGALVYDKPAGLTLTADKPLAKAEFELKQAGGEATLLTSSVNGTEVTIELGAELPRSAEFTLTATALEATDGSTPLGTYHLAFKTSGGPRVIAVDTGMVGIGQNARIVVTFDQPLSEAQDIAKFVSVTGAPAVVTKYGSSAVIQLAGVPKCQDFSISVSKDIASNYGIPAGAPWSRSQRTVCHSVSVAGYSRQGRAITAYEFGNGSRTILFVGGIHGNEYSTASLMRRWVDELEARAREIPADKRIVVVPQINPDGAAGGSRVNAGNVDLNRNFDTSDWTADITTVNNQPFPGGGGTAAMSEPEARAMAALASRLRPELTLSYHSIGGLLAANQAGHSVSAAALYAQLSGYRNATGQTAAVFEYAISGTWDDWLAERLGAASVLIELGSHSYHQFERNQAAMWAMVRS